jgi:hypothetical protein
MAGNPLKLQIDVNNYLNNDYEFYLSKISGKSLSNPSEYFQYREMVQRQIKTSAVSALYGTIYQALRNGKRSDGVTDLVNGGGGMIAGSPSMSDNNINEFTLALAKTLNEQLDKVVDMICPVDVSTIATSRLKASGNARGIL